MAVRSTFLATLYGATEDPNTSSYTTIASATVAAYAGAANKAFYILKPQATWLVEGEPLVDVSGWQTNRNTARRKFTIESYPFYYNNAGDQDLDDIDTLITVLTKPFLWLKIAGGERNWPSDTLLVHPIICTGLEESINAEYGTRSITLTCELRLLN